MSKGAPQRIAILGAGPIGLEAVVLAHNLGFEATVYESGQVGEFVQRWGHIRMFTPFGWNTTSAGLKVLLRENPRLELPESTTCLTGRDYRDAYLVPLASSEALKDRIQVQATVLTIGRNSWRKTDPGDGRRPLPPFRLLVRVANGAERLDTADVILDCTGTYAKPNWIGDGGIPACGEISARQHVSYWLEDVTGAKKSHLENRSIVVIGGGYSAATTVCALTSLADSAPATWVIWLTHGPKSQPLPRIPNDPLRERDRLAVRANGLACRCDGNLEYHPQTFIDEIHCAGADQGYRIVARVNGSTKTWEVERVIAHVGYRPDATLTQELRVETPAGSPFTSEPDYYILGSKSLGRDSNFLIRDGHTQLERVFARLTGNPRFSVYERKAG